MKRTVWGAGGLWLALALVACGDAAPDAGACGDVPACRDGSVCVDGVCAQLCNVDSECPVSDPLCVGGACTSVPCDAATTTCPSGTVCLGTECRPAACGAQPCRQDQACVSGNCVALDCVGVTCPDSEVCFDSACFPPDCPSVACDTGDLCIGGQCELPACDTVSCNAGDVCADGRCVEQNCAGLDCPDGAACWRNACVRVSCVGVTCGTGSECVLGQCVPTDCGGGCPAGQSCNAGGWCEIACQVGSCPAGYSCVGSACVPRVEIVGVQPATLPEGDAQTTPVVIQVALNGGSAAPVSVDYATATGTANASDYVGRSGTLTFDVGETVETTQILINGDTQLEGDETFTLELSNPTNATLGPAASATITITNDDVVSLSWSAAAQAPVENGATTVTVTATLDAASSENVAAQYSISGSATNPADHNATGGSIFVPAGMLSADVTFSVVDDALDEVDETVVVTLGLVTNAMLAVPAVHTVTIVDDDAPPTIDVINDAMVLEGNSASQDVTIQVDLDAPSGRTITVAYATVDDTAVEPADYILTSGTLTWAPGQTSLDIDVPVLGETMYEADESLQLVLSAPTNAALGVDTATIDITNDDTPPNVAWTGSFQKVREDGPMITLTAALDAVSGLDAAVPFTVGGDATHPTDHDLVAGMVLITAGTLSADVVFSVVDDAVPEPPETIVATLGTAVDATTVAPTAQTVLVGMPEQFTLVLGVGQASTCGAHGPNPTLDFTHIDKTQPITVDWSTSIVSATSGCTPIIQSRFHGIAIYDGVSGTSLFSDGVTYSGSMDLVQFLDVRDSLRIHIYITGCFQGGSPCSTLQADGSITMTADFP